MHVVLSILEIMVFFFSVATLMATYAKRWYSSPSSLTQSIALAVLTFASLVAVVNAVIVFAAGGVGILAFALLVLLTAPALLVLFVTVLDGLPRVWRLIVDLFYRFLKLFPRLLRLIDRASDRLVELLKKLDPPADEKKS